MITCFPVPDSSRDLYFALSNSINLTNKPLSATYKMAGLYAIYKGKRCYYVGQSQNLASRISQHLSGKYESCDRVEIYTPCSNGWPSFYDLEKQSRKNILEDNELLLMKMLKPIENLIIDHDFDLPEDHAFHTLIEGRQSCIDIYRNGGHITVTDDYVFPIECIDRRLLEDFNKYVNSPQKGEF